MNGDNPEFINRAATDFLHAKSLELFGGLTGVRDDGLVESALASAQNVWLYAGGDLFDIAAAYAFHLSHAQAFFDGNKRTGVSVALTFLEINGVDCPQDDGRIYDALIAIAERRMDKADLARVLRDWLTAQ